MSQRIKKPVFGSAADWYLQRPDDESSLLRGDNNTLVTSSTNPLDNFLNKDFYCWDIKKRGLDDCCFNHMVGLPQKNDEEHPFYDYEREMFDKMETGKHCWIKKSKGGLAPYWNKDTDDHGKICHKCNFLVLKDKKYTPDDFITYGK